MIMPISHKGKWLFVIASLLPSALLRAQFNIAILPTGGVYLKSQLWNISVTNTGTSTVDATLHLEMKDIQTRQTVLSAQTAPFRVGPGIKKIQPSNIEPVV